MLAWSEGTDNGRPESGSWLWRHYGRGELFLSYSDHPQTCHAKPKTQINRRRTLQLLSRWWDAYRKQLGLKDFSPKSQDAVALQQIKERGALPMIDRGDIRRAIDRYSYLGFTAGRWLYGGFRLHELTAWWNSKKRAERSERLMCRAESPQLSHSVICIIVCLSWAVNHYRDNAITYKVTRQKCQRTEAGETAIATYRVMALMLLRSMQNTRRS